MMKEKVLDYCLQNRLFKRGDRVLLAVSGGADSMCLAHLFLQWAPEYGLRLMAAHVEHGIRGEQSVADMELVRAFCKQNGLPLRVCRTCIPALASERKQGLEQTAREERQRFFSVLKAEYGIHTVATAHQATDNAETVLLHLTRGASLNGLKGMPPLCEGMIRPLLCVTKEETEQYCRDHAVPYSYDETNDDVHYSRNLIRKEILPLLERINPQFVHTVGSNSRNLQEQDAYIERAAQRIFEERVTVEDGRVRLRVAEGEEEILLDRVVLRMAKALGVECDVYTPHRLSVRALIRNGQTGKRVHLSHGLCASFSYGELILFFEEKTEKELTELTVSGTGSYSLGSALLIVEEAVETEWEHGAHYADAEKLFSHRAVLRTRRDGDRFKPYGSGTKKLKEYFIDRKIPREQREELLLLAEDNEILYVGGTEISDRIRVDKNTKIAVKLRYLPSTEGRL